MEKNYPREARAVPRGQDIGVNLGGCVGVFQRVKARCYGLYRVSQIPCVENLVPNIAVLRGGMFWGD
jgi:hypothetical protein